MSATLETLRPRFARYAKARDDQRGGAGLPPGATERERTVLINALVKERNDFADAACEVLAKAVGCTWLEMRVALTGGLR